MLAVDGKRRLRLECGVGLNRDVRKRDLSILAKEIMA